MRDEIEKLLASAEDKVDKAFKSLDISLLELRKQLDTVREEMKDNFRNFKQTLDICRDNACKTLEDLPTEHQFEITDFLHDIQTTTDDIVKTCESCKFKLNIVDRPEILSLNKTIGTQTDNLIKYVPQVDGNFLLDVDAYRDEHNAQDMYGSLNTIVASTAGDNVHSQTLPGNRSSEGGTVKNISNNNGKKAARMSCGSSSGLENASILNDFPAAPPSVLSPIGTMPLIAVNTQSNGANCTIAPVRYIFGSLGASAAQFNSPHGFCLGVNDEIIVADTNNHRIKVFEKDGTFKFQFGETGTQQGQLWLPRKVAVMQADSKFVVCDRGSERSRMQIFTKDGQFIKRIFITFIDIVTCLTVTNDGSIVVIDSVMPSVYFMSEDGAIISWFKCGTNVIEPSDVAIRGSYLYICDYKSHRVAVFAQDGEFQHHISDERVIHYPSGICISDAGDMLIGDSHGNRFHVACLSRDGVLQSEYVCPFPMVARCCGLKITSDGYIVTVAKNNNQVLVLNTPQIREARMQ